MQLYQLKFKRTVVKAMHTDNGFASDSKNTTKFYYQEGRIHKQGRGFQGFGVIKEINQRAGITTHTRYKQGFPYSGMVEDHWTYATADGSTSNNNYLSKSSNRGFTQSSPDAPFVPYAIYQSSESKTLDGANKTANVSDTTLNALGQPTTTTTQVCDAGQLNDNVTAISCNNSPWSQTTTTTISYKTGSDEQAIISRPNKTTTTTTVSYDDDLGSTGHTQAVTKTIVYDEDDWTVTSTTTKDTNDATVPTLTQSFAYYPSGNTQGLVKSVTTTGSGTDNHSIQGARWVQSNYTTDGYFVTSSHNSQWDTEVNASSQTVIEATGQVATTTDANGNTVTNTYDDYHRLVKVSTAGVPDVVTAMQACDGLAVADCQADSTEVYRQVSQQAGTPTTMTYLDKVGRVLRTTTVGFDGELQQSSTEYNRKGQVVSQQDPAGEVSFATYDLLGRPATKTVNYLPQHYLVSYDYQGLTTNLTITPQGTGSERTISRTVNSAGKLLLSVDEADHNTEYRITPPIYRR